VNSQEVAFWGVTYAYQNLIGSVFIGLTIMGAGLRIARVLRGEREATVFHRHSALVSGAERLSRAAKRSEAFTLAVVAQH
jgi:hypothetical protein